MLLDLAGRPARSGLVADAHRRGWDACDGTLEWPGDSTAPRVAWTITDDDKRAVLRAKLARLQSDPMVWERRLALSLEAVDRWLDWLGDPPPGNEYKWTTDRDVYQQRREAARTRSIDGQS